MRVFDAPAIRNVALAGHSGAGKTQLASALLFTAGAVNRLGKVDEGTPVTDYDEEAIARTQTPLHCRRTSRDPAQPRTFLPRS